MLFTCFFLAYLLGSIPFGLLLTRAAGLGDIRKVGSGNIGATNVLRTGNKKLAFATLLLDAGKGFIAVVLVGIYETKLRAHLGDSASLYYVHAAALGAVLGHIFPVWLKFKGGKGVATAYGTMLALMPMVGMMALGIWIAVFLATRISSLSAITSFAISPLLPFAVLGTESALILTLALLPISALVIGRHKENIRRLLAGKEPRFGRK